MKKLFIIAILLVQDVVLAQVVYNTNAGSARFISESNSSFVQNFAAQPTCNSRVVAMYYYYRPDVSMSSASLLDFIISAGTIDCSVKVWEFNTREAANQGYLTETPIISLSDNPSQNVVHDITAGKFYLLELLVKDCDATVTVSTENSSYFDDNWKEDKCVGCLSGFNPQEGAYILSAWVRDNSVALGAVDYTKPHIIVTSGIYSIDCSPSGEIIDGWQRIEKEVQVDANVATEIELVCDASGDCFFDDIRFYPKDGSMVTYVYDPLTRRLMAELDERNYAKIYEYDEQGKLIRVKKETEMGIMTIQENRENNSKE